MTTDIVKRLREAPPETPIYHFADEIAALLDRIDAAERENERLRRSQIRRVGYVCEQCGWTLSAEPPKRDAADGREG